MPNEIPHTFPKSVMRPFLNVSHLMARSECSKILGFRAQSDSIVLAGKVDKSGIGSPSKDGHEGDNTLQDMYKILSPHPRV